MNTELDYLIDEFLYNNFKVENIYRIKIEAKNAGFEKSLDKPGFVFPIRGQAKYYFNDSPYIAKSGNIIHGGANMDIDKKVMGSSSWELVTVLYNIENSKLDLNNSHFDIKIGENAKVINLLLKLEESFKNNSKIDKFKRDSIFRLILEEIFISASKEKKDSSKEIFEDILENINYNYMDHISVKELARDFGLSENQLYYIFNKYLEVSPSNYIKDFRLNRAKKLLIDTDFTIKEISESVGYYDPLHFSKIFKNENNLSPSDFRKNFQE